MTAASAPPNPGTTPASSPAWQRLERYALGFTYAGTQLRDHVYGRATRQFARGDTARDALKTPEAVRERQAQIRRFMTESLGGLPPSNTPLNARVTGTVQANGFAIEKIIFEARPHHYVTANLYLPAARSGRTAAVLFLSGHHNTAKQVSEYQGVCQTLVQAGLIVFAQDPVGQGERLSYYDPGSKSTLVRPGTGEHDHAGVQTRFVGDQIARYFLHDSMRSIDYLLTRPEVDGARIGVTGNSGGGTQTSLVMLADPRIAAAAPATFITSREIYMWTGQPQDAEQNWFGFTAAGFDHEDILLAMAPKPVCVLAVKYDFFPIEGTRRTVSRAQRVWDLHGRRDALQLVEDQTTHTYSPVLARAAATFFARHLLQKDVDLTSFRPAPLPEPELWATKSGQVRSEFPDAEFVFEANLARLATAEETRRALPAAERKSRSTTWLREQVLREREATEPNLRRVERSSPVDDFNVDIAFWWSQPRLANLGMLFRPREKTGRMPVTIALWDDGTNALSRHAEWLRAECGRGCAVLVLNLCGMGPLKPDPLNSRAENAFPTFRKLVDDLSFLGDSLVALRTFETLRALDVVSAWPDFTPGEIRVYAHGRMGVHGRLAAAIDRRIVECDWQEGFRFADLVRNRNYDATDIKSVILPGALRYFDLDDL
jgi:cephalosporin-C deacetylase-like acetyl esterase